MIKVLLLKHQIATKMKTVTLRNGLTVLAKETKSGINAVTFVNFTQAYSKAKELTAKGIDCHVIGFGQPAKYIAIV